MVVVVVVVVAGKSREPRMVPTPKPTGNPSKSNCFSSLLFCSPPLEMSRFVSFPTLIEVISPESSISSEMSLERILLRSLSEFHCN